MSILAQAIINVSETAGLNENVINTPPGIYEEPVVDTNTAQSDFYSEAGMNINNAMYGMNNEQSTNSEYVSYHFLIWYTHILVTKQSINILPTHDKNRLLYHYDLLFIGNSYTNKFI